MKRAMPPLLRIRFDSYGSEATKDKQFSFAYASHVRDCQSYRVKPVVPQNKIKRKWRGYSLPRHGQIVLGYLIESFFALRDSSFSSVIINLPSSYLASIFSLSIPSGSTKLLDISPKLLSQR